MTTCLEWQTKTGGRAVVLPLVRVSRFVPLCYIATANRVRPPHRTENEACCVWRSAAVKQPSVRSLLFKIECFNPTTDAAVSPLRQKNRSCEFSLFKMTCSRIGTSHTYRTGTPNDVVVLPLWLQTRHICASGSLDGSTSQPFHAVRQPTGSD